jgi:hypothetical protein
MAKPLAAAPYLPAQGSQLVNPTTGGMSDTFYRLLIDTARRLGYGPRPASQYVSPGPPPWSYVAPGRGAMAVPAGYTCLLRRHDDGPTVPAGNGGLYPLQMGDVLVIDWVTTSSENGPQAQPVPTLSWFPEF